MARVIIDNVLPGSMIITDEWKCTKALQDMPEYLHRTVTHSINLVNPLDQDVHTQKIEVFWYLFKRFLREKNGISKEQHEDLLTQFILKHNIPKEKQFNQLFLLLRINN
ncbi:hypothetical protein DMUE_2757 [Dictyocoela muelleri]|nr:hypothetical protein DMUE_2757 [Dictyocoela muelleri]